MNVKYLPGLNALRFFAAFFVIISHASIGSFYKFDKTPYAFLNRGGDAVEFFFTLSGFLITYLLLVEKDSTHTISIKHFYLRRVFRIWPLYFIVVVIGFVLFELVYPRVFHQSYFSFPLAEGVFCFLFFLPNYITANYSAGLLHPLWSIGVEEQFYLFWAPLFKVFRKRIFPLIVVFILISSVFYGLLYESFFSFNKEITRFFLTQRFYAMAIGCLFGYILFTHQAKYARSFFSGKWMQFVVLAVIVIHYMINIGFTYTVYFHLFIPFLYGLLILNVSSIERKLISLEKKPFVYLGIISYGLYMYHMLIDYLLRFLFPVLVRHAPVEVLIPLYYLLLLSITIVVAELSYKYVESYFLRLKHKYAA